MYKIIGADHKEYGPVTAEQIRQWVAEGRANGQTMLLADGATEWKPLSAFPEFAGIAASPPPFSSGPAPVPTPEELFARDYDVDIGSCITRGWNLVKGNFWPIVGTTFLVTLVNGGINQGLGLISRGAVQAMIIQHEISTHAVMLVALTSVLGAPVAAILMGGLFNYYLKLIRGEPAGVGDAFAGIGPATGPLALLGLVKSLLTLLGLAACVIPGIYLSVAWFFAVPILIDRQLGFWEAMELSRKMVSKHWFVVFALGLVAGLVSISGMIACCVGIFATIPIGLAAWMHAYEDILGRRTR